MAYKNITETFLEQTFPDGFGEITKIVTMNAKKQGHTNLTISHFPCCQITVNHVCRIAVVRTICRLRI